MTNLCQGSQFPGGNQLYFCKLKAYIICLVKWIQGNKMSRNGQQWNEVTQDTVQCWRCSNVSKFSVLWLTWVEASWSIPSHSFLVGSLSSSISHWLCGVGGGVETSDMMLLQLAVFNCSCRLSRSSARNSWQSCCNNIHTHISTCTSNLPIMELCHFWYSLNLYLTTISQLRNFNQDSQSLAKNCLLNMNFTANPNYDLQWTITSQGKLISSSIWPQHLFMDKTAQKH